MVISGVHDYQNVIKRFLQEAPVIAVPREDIGMQNIINVYIQKGAVHLVTNGVQDFLSVIKR